MQQQPSAFRCQKIHPFYLKFREKLNEFVRRIEKQQEKAQELLKSRCGEKTYAVRFSASKG